MKKKLFAGLLALSMFALLTACGGQPAEPSAEATAATEEVTESQPGGWEGDSIVYENEQGWSLTMPASWEGRFDVVDEAGSVHICASSSHDEENGGILFTVMRLDAAEADEMADVVPVTPLATLDDGTRYVAVLPSDVQFNPEFAEDYQDMNKDVESVLGTFTLTADAAAETPANTQDPGEENSSTGAPAPDADRTEEVAALAGRWETERPVDSEAYLQIGADGSWSLFMWYREPAEYREVDVSCPQPESPMPTTQNRMADKRPTSNLRPQRRTTSDTI